ncbi:hypothetical protein [Peribacillus frigoritolerans]|uniref:hypothetical protein n=1 Tax=Peribacillus frigoritolerans TaxID=450367 RepID=UPI002079E45E|nr:hypothetical protein [Peribacillus frigoritolerans]USK65879.1 hypothetical protein LIT26_04270 [Peribacillus frigoritolerans]
MLPTIEELERHLIEKMTNEDIAKLYRVSYQKIIQLIKKYNLNPSKLRKVDTFIVYEHWIDGEVVYVGSGQWYRCRRYTNRRNSEHKQLMAEGKVTYKIVDEFREVGKAREYEAKLIKYYKLLGQAKFNKKVNYT